MRTRCGWQARYLSAGRAAAVVTVCPQLAEKTCRSAVFPLAAFTASKLLVTCGRQTSRGYSPSALCKHLCSSVHKRLQGVILGSRS